MVQLHRRHEPDHPNHTDAQAGDDSGLHGVSHPSEGSGKDLHRHEYRLKGDNDGHDIGPTFNDPGVPGVNAKNGPAEQQHQKGNDSHGAHAHDQTHPDTLPDPVVALGAKVLSHEGGNGYAEGTGDHPHEGIGLAVGRPGRHDHGAEGIDAGLNEGIGQVKGDELKPGRDADEQDAL